MSDIIRANGALAQIERPGLADRIVARLPGIGRYTAGPTVAHGLRKMRELSGRGIGSIVNVLGEHDTAPKAIGKTFLQYGMLIDGIAGEALLRPSISLKPTQFGLHENGGRETAAQLMRELARSAHERGIFVWLDMEGSHATDFTLNMYRDFTRRGIRAGVALQANLKRTGADLSRLASFCRSEDAAVSVRLVRGIYREDESVAFASRREMHDSFANLMRAAFFEGGEKFMVSVGTHHPDQVVRALALSAEFPGRLNDLQFLLGAAEVIPRALSERGVDCTYYVPCGQRFLDYGIRRLKENPGGFWGLISARFRERRNMRKVESFLAGSLQVDLSDPALGITGPGY